jgi:hypothetical protein
MENTTIENPIIEAIRRGDRDAALALIHAGSGINDYDHGVTPLISEVQRGRTPIIAAAEKGDVVVLKALLQAGADPNATENPNMAPFLRTALSYAAEKGHDEIVAELLNSGANIEAKDKHIGGEIGKQTPLHYACENGHLKVVCQLLEKGAKVNAKDSTGGTPLMNAAKSGNPEIVRLLINKGALVNDRTKSNGWSALIASVPLFIEVPKHSKPIEVMSVLLEHGADPNLDLGQTSTPLMSACARGCIEMVDLLLSYGADVNRQDALYKTTALVDAAMVAAPKIVERLLSEGADPNVVDKERRTALDWAILRRQNENITILKAAGAKTGKEMVVLISK